MYPPVFDEELMASMKRSFFWLVITVIGMFIITEIDNHVANFPENGLSSIWMIAGMFLVVLQPLKNT